MATPRGNYEVIVIGAGPSGLAVAKTFLQLRPDIGILIIDSGESIGGTWSKERLYPNLRCEAGYGFFHFSDLPMDNQDITPEGWIPGVAVHRYLDRYASHFDLHRHILLSTVVMKASRSSSSTDEKTAAKWDLEIQTTNLGQQPGKLSCEKLIVATGLTSEPFLPPIPIYQYRGLVYHSKDFGLQATQSALTGSSVKNVTVYGGSKSAFEAVYYLARSLKHVDWVIRPDGGGVSLMTPLKLLGCFNSFKLNNTRFFGALSPNVFDTQSFCYRWVHGPKRLFFAEWLIIVIWRISTWMVCLPARYNLTSNGKKLKPSLGLESSFWSPATLSVMTLPGFWDELHHGGRITVHRQSVKELRDHSVVLEDGKCLASDAMIFATGWKAKHSIFADEDCGELGLPSPYAVSPNTRDLWQQLRSTADRYAVSTLPLLRKSPPGFSDYAVEDDYHLYRFLVPASEKFADSSIAFIGFLRTTGLHMVLEAQALWTAAYMLGKLKLPPHVKRIEEAARTNAWIRRRYICGRKVPFVLVDWHAYVDMLYRDLGLQPRRKKSWFATMLSPYTPEDFRGIVDEWQSPHEEQQHSPWTRFLFVFFFLLLMIVVIVEFLLPGFLVGVELL